MVKSNPLQKKYNFFDFDGLPFQQTGIKGKFNKLIKKKKMKKIAKLFVAVALVTFAVSCGNTAEKAADAATETATEAANAATDAAANATDAAATAVQNAADSGAAAVSAAADSVMAK